MARHLSNTTIFTMKRNAELDIKWSDGLRAAWSGGLGTTAVVAPAVQRSPLQLIYIKLCVALHCEFSSNR